MKSTSCRILAIVLFCVAGLAAPKAAIAQEAAAPLTKEQVLDHWAAALGGRENLQNVRTIHLRGTLATGGLKGTYDRWTTSRGEFRMALDIPGAFRQVHIFDGQKGWVLDMSGTVHELSGEILKAVVSGAYEASHSFLFSGRMSGHVEFGGEDASKEAYILRLEADGGSPVTVYLDKKAFLPKHEESSGPMGSRTISFSDWRDFAGIKIPGTVRQSNGDPRFDAVLTTEQIEINDPAAAELFTKPGESAPPVHFADGAGKTVIPAVVYAQHIFVPVRVNGSEAAWFFLDSGAGESVVSRPWAQKAGLAFGGAIRGQGTGAGSATLGMARNVVFDLPGVEVPTNTVAVWDFSPILPMLGREWDGILGYDVISRLVVRVDYEHKQITLYDPATFVAGDRAAVLPISFMGNLPLVHAKIVLPGRAPIDAECAIDSGADGFHLTTPFTNANHVLESVRKTISSSSVGAGGESKEFAGRIAGLQLGPYLLHAPIVEFSPDQRAGLLASPEIGALVGGEILQRFTVTFDFPHHRILLEPNSRFSDPFRTDESGLSLLAKGADFHRFEIDDVEPGSPAEAAGVRKGDILTAIDGHPASEFDLEKIDETLQQVGRRIRLTIERGGKTLSVSLELKERI